MRAISAIIQPPPHCEPWLAEVIEQAAKDTGVLWDNGAEASAKAREALLKQVVVAYERWQKETITVAEAAEMTGKSQETIRRQVRKGRLPAGRNSDQGHIRIRRGDVQRLEQRKTKKYNPLADAQDIARARRAS